MADYRLSVAAEEDILAIFHSSLSAFGPRQTETYMAGLGRAFQNLADMPGLGRTAEDLRPGLFRFRYQSHMIFYSSEPNYIVIRRVLHARMDFESRL
jgi:toxin ParE1/3/4